MTEDTAPFPACEFPYMVLADRLEARIRRGEFGEYGQLAVQGPILLHRDLVAFVIESRLSRWAGNRRQIVTASRHGTYDHGCFRA